MTVIMKAKTLFFKILTDKDVKSLSEFTIQHKSKKSEFRFEELIKAFSDEDFNKAWESLFEIVQIAAPVLLEVELDPLATKEQIGRRAVTEVLRASLILGSLTIQKQSTIPVGLLQMVVFLHGIFLRFPIKNDNLKNGICQLCETLWFRDVFVKEELIANSVPYLLERSLHIKGTKADVKRVWAWKDALEFLLVSNEHNEETRNDLLSLLKRCVSSPLYPTQLEGMKFIEFVLCFNIEMTMMFHDAIKLRLPHCKPGDGGLYGTIYYNAWTHAVKEEKIELKKKLELCCIQDIMYHAVHVQRKRVKSLVPILRKFMGAFHKKKKEVQVLRMLRDLYEPILWRALKAANGAVRANAAEIFFDVFPLEDPDFNIADTETELQRQMLVIQDLLTDEYPLVRSISAVGVCLAMSCHWELFSIEMIKNFLKILVDDLACDSSSAEVRCSVVKGITLLSGNQLAIPVLKAYLPVLINLFHDVSDVVRVAFCHLLLVVKKIRFIKYWDIVPVDHLLARLEEDKPTVGKCIVELMFNSYLPQRKPQGFWLSRVIELIKTDRSASKNFFMHLPNFLKVDVLGDFIILICRTLSVYVQSKDKKPTKKAARAENKENQVAVASGHTNSKDEDDGKNTFDSPYVVGGLLDAVTILWLGISSSLEKEENKKLYKGLVARFTKYLPPLLKYYKDSKISSPILTLCGLMPLSFIPGVAETSMAKLKKVTVEQPSEYSVLIVCLCNQGKSEDILILIKNWIEHGLHKELSSPATKRKKKNEKVETKPNPLLGVMFLEALLEQPICKEVLKNNVDSLKEILALMEPLQNTIRDAKKTLEDENQKTYFIKCFSNITKLAVLLQETNRDDAFVRQLLTWTADTFFLSQSSRGNSIRKSSRRSDSIPDGTTTWKELGLTISKDLFRISADVLLMGFAKENASEYVDCCKSALSSALGPMMLKYSLTLIYHISHQCRYQIIKDDLFRNYLGLIQSSLIFVLQSLENEEFFLKIPEAERSEIKLKLRELLLFHMRQVPVKSEDTHALIKKIFEAVCLTIEPFMQKALADPDLEIKLSQQCLMFLSFVTGNEKLLKPFITELLEWNKDKDLKESLTAFIIVSQTIKESKGLHEKLQEEIQLVKNSFEEKFLPMDLENASEDDICILTHAKRLLDYLATCS